ncbi:MAG: DUF2520 domain-containing protein, partial [Bacteroidota bacterium]|nr:DUF2520 domain-containing protein [Bacteroidota bacterium]
REMSQILNAEAVSDIKQIKTSIDLCLIAVADSAIETVAKQLNMSKTLVVHTSGATSKEVLNRFQNYGVLYPLQSIRKEMQYIPPVPFLVDANTIENTHILQHLASSTGNEVNTASDEQRLQLHLAAVFCSNFTNHLYALTQEYCAKQNVSFPLLYPLIKETAERLQWFGAAELQTGPAIRHDGNTIERHLQLLQSYPHLHNLYQIFTKSIQDFSNTAHG